MWGTSQGRRKWRLVRERGGEGVQGSARGRQRVQSAMQFPGPSKKVPSPICSRPDELVFFPFLGSGGAALRCRFLLLCFLFPRLNFN